MAANLENVLVLKQKIIDDYKNLDNNFDMVLVESSGGLLVPYCEDGLLCDIAQELDLPVLLIVGNKLGAINHTLLTIEGLRSRNMEIKGLIFNDVNERSDETICAENVRIIEKMTGVKSLCSLPYDVDIDNLYKILVGAIHELPLL